MNYELYKKFYRTCMIGSSIVIYILAAFMFLLSLGGGITLGFDTVYIAGIVFCIAVISTRLWQDLAYPKSFYKKSVRIFNSIFCVQLFDEYYHIESKNEASSGASDIRYDSLYKAFESCELFILFIAPRQAHMIPKTCLSDDAALRLRSILKEKLGRKFSFR